MSEEVKKVQEQPEAQEAQEPQEPSENQQAIFGKTVARTVQLNNLDKELLIRFMDFEGQCEIKTCPGDIYKIVNALMDYSRLLETAAQEWDLTSYHKAVYEVSAEQLRKIANKFAFGIGYNYYEAVEKCKKRLEQQKKRGQGSSDDVGEEALALTLKRGSKQKNSQTKKSEDPRGQEKSDD